MPISTAPYKRTYAHTKARGSERTVVCTFCGRKFPRYKAFIIRRRGLSLRDPTLRKQVDRRYLHVTRHKAYVCPSCARFRGIVQPGKSVRKKHLRR